MRLGYQQDMLRYSEIELENEGRPSRKELLWAVAATPLLIVQVIGWSLRLIRGFRGQPLEISSWFDIYVSRSEPSWHFAAGVAMYVVFLAFALLLLWACTLQFQRWLYWRHRT